MKQSEFADLELVNGWASVRGRGPTTEKWDVATVGTERSRQNESCLEKRLTGQCITILLYLPPKFKAHRSKRAILLY
jgi:hypothetical protein